MALRSLTRIDTSPNPLTRRVDSFMTSPLSVVGFHDNLLLEEYCTRAYVFFPSTHPIMKDAIFERAAQRLALAAVGRSVDLLSKRRERKAAKKRKKRAAHLPSAARL